GAEIAQSAVDKIDPLREQEAAPVAEVGVVAAELMPVIAQRQRDLETAGQRFEPSEMGNPLRLGQPVEPHAPVPVAIAVAQDGLREFGWLHRIEKRFAKPGMDARAFEPQIEILSTCPVSRG